MEGNQDTEPKDSTPKVRRKSYWEREFVPVDESEPLTAKGKPFSERFTARGLRGIAEKREQKQQQEEYERQQREAAEQKTADFLRSLPEFSDSSEARIQKVSRELVKTLSPSPDRTR